MNPLITGRPWLHYQVINARLPAPLKAANAAGEVGRSVGGGCGPHYQLADMFDGFQFRGLKDKLAGSVKMYRRAFHDAVVHEKTTPSRWSARS